MDDGRRGATVESRLDGRERLERGRARPGEFDVARGVLPRGAEIAQLEEVLARGLALEPEHVFWLEVQVEDPVRVQVLDAR